MRRNEALPLEVVRDLLGITRALYRSERAKPAPDARTVEALRTVGEKLRRALELGRNEPGSMGARSAWNWAEQATETLEPLLAGLELAPAVRATIARLKKRY
jgi:hypothetical protein